MPKQQVFFFSGRSRGDDYVTNATAVHLPLEAMVQYNIVIFKDGGNDGAEFEPHTDKGLRGGILRGIAVLNVQPVSVNRVILLT